jgi:hypothetical protein
MAYIGTFQSLPPRARGDEGDTAVYQQKTGRARGKIWHVIKWGGQWRTIGQLGAELVTTDDIVSLAWNKTTKTGSNITDIETRKMSDLQELAYGSMYVTGNSTADTSGADGTFVQITRFASSGESLNTTIDTTSNYIGVTYAGVYKIAYSVSFSGAPTVTFDLQAYHIIPGVSTTAITESRIRRKLGAGGDVGNANGVALLDLAADDRVDLRIASIGFASQSYTIVDSTLCLLRVG